MNKIYILLPVHNRKDITKEFIFCLKAQSYQNYHLVLINDGSTDATEEMVRENIEFLTVLKGKGNWWWAGSLQEGYKWLKSLSIPRDDVVLIINDDTVFETDFLETAMDLINDMKNTLLLAYCYSKQTKQLIDSGVYADWQHLKFEQASAVDKINCLSTRGLFLHIEDFFMIGGFYPRILPHYASDYEFTIRASRKGMSLITVPELKLWVDEVATGYHFVNADSFMTFIKKYFSKKSVQNPLVWTVFIALACPWRWKLQNWFRVWMRTGKTIVKYFLKKS
ncbi:MAG: glycosyltransferase family 2 protein [Deltaproteobacteria bacterium]